MAQRQETIPGTQQDRIKDLDAQAAKYREARDIRMQCTQAEVDEKVKLHELMVKHADKLSKNEDGETVYRLIDAEPAEEVALVVVEESVKVRKVKEAPKRSTNGHATTEVTVS